MRDAPPEESLPPQIECKARAAGRMEIVLCGARRGDYWQQCGCCGVDAPLVLDKHTRALFQFTKRIFADACYQGPRVASAAARTGRWIVEVVNATSCANSSSCQSGGLRNEPWRGSAATPPSTRFRASRLHRRRLRPSCHDPHYATAPCHKRLSMIHFFPDRL